jgi:hypothetical protein
MAFNALSGTVSAPDLIATGSFSGSYTGDGTGLQKVLGIVNNTSNQGDRRILFYNQNGSDFSLDANSGLTFGTNNVLNIPATTASAGLNLAGIFAGTATTSSYLALDSNNNVVLTSSAGGSGGGGTISYSRRFITSTATASASDTLIGVSASSPLDIRLSSATQYEDGQYFTVKDEAGNSDTLNITILPSGSETIDGRTSIMLESPFAAVNIYTNGVDKFFIY